MSLKKACKILLKKVLPKKYYILLANGAIVVPRYYKGIIEDAERFRDLSLEDSDKKDILLLRKYGHILDKALHRPDATPGHSKVIYEDLINIIKRLENTTYLNDPTYAWAKSKIEKYNSLQQNPETFVPFEGGALTPSIEISALESLIKARRSNRNFEEKTVDQNIIDQLKALGNWAASSCNKQPIEVYTTNDPQKAAECLKCCKGGTGFSDFIPSFWAFTVNCRGYVWPSEMFLPTLDCSLGAQNVFLAVTTMGLSGTILSWAQKDEEEEKTLRELLEIPKDQIIIFCAVIGYAKTTFLTPARKV